jgi:glyoxylase-like metal-dependent hydrolase (beta-lactamase superfamily II)
VRILAVVTEPRAQAQKIVRVIPTVMRWFVPDDRMGGAESDAYAVVSEGEVVLIDPLPLAETELRKLGEIQAIILTASCHQRSAWRYRRSFGVDVYAPEGAASLEEDPDMSYSGGDALPAGLIAFHAPGPLEAMYALWLTRPRPVIFLSDLLVHDGSGVPRFFATEQLEDPWRTRTSVERILDQLPLDVLCFAHGPPILNDGSAALREALERDRGLATHP